MCQDLPQLNLLDRRKNTKYFSTEKRKDHQSTSEASYTESMRQPGHHINSTRQKGKRSSTLFDTNAMGLKAIGRLQGATISFGREGTQVGSYKQEVNQTSWALVRHRFWKTLSGRRSWEEGGHDLQLRMTTIAQPQGELQEWKILYQT